MATQFLSKGLHLLSLSTDTAIHGERQADHDLPDLVLSGNVDDGFDILTLITAVKNGERARQYATRITESYTNPPIANVQSQTARDCASNNKRGSRRPIYIRLFVSRRASSSFSLYLPPA